MLALFARERTGEGQEVNTSLLGSQAWLGSVVLQRCPVMDTGVPRPWTTGEPDGRLYYLEHDYSEGAMAPLRTRVQAFLEIIG